MRDGHEVVLIEFSGDEPMSVITRDVDGRFHHYDCGWCRRDGVLLWSKSGNSLYLEGGDHDYWVLPELLAEARSGDDSRPTGRRFLNVPPRWADPDTLLNDDNETDRMFWCSVCADFLPWADEGNVCPHITWCDKCQVFTGRGCDDP